MGLLLEWCLDFKICFEIVSFITDKMLKFKLKNGNNKRFVLRRCEKHSRIHLHDVTRTFTFLLVLAHFVNELRVIIMQVKIKRVDMTSIYS